MRLITSNDLRHEGNSFTLTRWVLAISVMFSHSWDLTLTRVGQDPSVRFLTIPVSELAVFLFFSLSGFLVTGSLQKRGSVDFIIARLTRMGPGLWAMLLLTALAAGAIAQNQNYFSYITSPSTQKYLWYNGTLSGGAYIIDGVFSQNPFPAFNGSLWTIPQEVRCYIILCILGLLGITGNRRLFSALFVLFIICNLIIDQHIISSLYKPRQLANSFFIGVAFYLWKDEIRLSWGVSGGLLCLTLVTAHNIQNQQISIFLLQASFAYFMLVFCLACPMWLKTVSVRLPDYSYGIYIYAFPVEQAVIYSGMEHSPIHNFAVSLVCTMPLAALSWHLVESPALKFRMRQVKAR